MPRTKRKKANRAEIGARLDMAVTDVKENGFNGRTVAEVAASHGVLKSSLAFRLSQARAEGAPIARRNLDGSEVGADDQPRKRFSANGLSGMGGGSGAEEGDGGGDTCILQVNAPEGAETANSLVAGDLGARVRAWIERSIRVGSVAPLPVRSAGDLRALLGAYLDTFPKESKGGGKGGALVQVQVLASASEPRRAPAIEVKAVPITDSTNESGPDPAAIEAGQGEAARVT